MTIGREITRRFKTETETEIKAGTRRPQAQNHARASAAAAAAAAQRDDLREGGRSRLQRTFSQNSWRGERQAPATFQRKLMEGFQRKLMEGGGGPPGTSPFSTPGGSPAAGPRRGCTAGLARGRPAPGPEATPTFVGYAHVPGGTALWGVPAGCITVSDEGPAPPTCARAIEPEGRDSEAEANGSTTTGAKAG